MQELQKKKKKSKEVDTKNGNHCQVIHTSIFFFASIICLQHLNESILGASRRPK